MPESTETALLETREAGLPPATAPAAGELPPGGARWAVPSYQSFIGLVNLVSRSYRFTFDEALRSSRQNAEAIENDLAVEQALWYRIAPVAQLSWHLEADDETDPRQAKAVEKITRVLKSTLDFQSMRLALLRNGVFVGRGGVQLIYEWDYSSGEKGLRIRDWRPVHGDKMVFRWSGDVGILVNSAFDGPKETTDRGYAYFLSPSDREAFVVHRHERRDRSFYQPDLAGAIEGSGVRDRIWHFWWLKANFLALLSDFADRFANGLWEAWFDQSNPESKAEVEAAIAAYRTNRLLLWPRDKDGKTPYGLSVKDVGQQNPAFLLNLIQDYFDRYIRLYILGQEASAENGLGMGGDEAGLHEATLATVQKFDAVNLDCTFNRDLMPVLVKYNCPDCPPNSIRYTSDIDNADGAQQLEFAQIIKGLGGDLDLDHLYAVSGLPKPQPGRAVLSAAQPMSATALSQTPDGTPVAGGGPVQGQADPGQPPTTDEQAAPPPTPPQGQTILNV